MRSRLLKRAAEFSLPDLSKPTLNLQEPTKPLPSVLPKRSPLAERSSSSPFSFTNNQGKVLPAISSTTGALFGPQGSFKSPFSKPTPDESHNLPFLSREQSHKPNLTSGQHYEQGFAPYQQKLDFTGRENFAKNLPYDPANRSQEYDNRVETLNSADAKALNNPEFYGKFKEKADQEYINNMFRHTKAPEGYKRTSVSTGPSGSHYNTFTNKLVLDQDSDINTYMHELTHGLGALSRRIPLWDRSQIAYQPDPDSKPSTGFNPLGDKYNADSEYPAMMAGRLAQLKTDQRANEMAHSTKLPAQLASALGSPNPFASTVGALAGNKGSATLTMPGGDIINPDKQKDIKDNYLRSVNTAFGEANRNNYFTPKSVEDTANIYPTLNKALPHMMLEKQNSDFLSLLALEKQAIGARSKRLARFEAAASNKNRAEPIRSLANKDIHQRANEIAKMQSQPGGYGNSLEEIPPKGLTPTASEVRTNSLYQGFKTRNANLLTSPAFRDRVAAIVAKADAEQELTGKSLLKSRLLARGYTRQFYNMTNAMKATIDRIAATGRHSNVKNDAIANVFDKHVPLNKPMENPNLAYAGFTSTGIRPRRTANETPEQIAAKESPVWYSGYPQISDGYLRKNRNHLNPGYLIEAPVDKLKEIGPHSPNFHPHKAVDTRGFTPEAVKALPNWKGETTPAHYESVFTAKSDDVLSTPLSRLFKLLPSESGFQRVK